MATCGEVLIEILTNYGVDTVFGIPGVHTVELYRGLARSNVRHVTPRHEQGAGFMADGYARASGRIAACFVITGPGLTNIATPMGQALADSIPMLVISSVNSRHELAMGEGRLHEMENQSNLIAGVARFSHTLLGVDELPRVLARAFTVFASARPGPVHIEIPVDVIKEAADHLETGAFALPSPPGPAPRGVDDAVRALESAAMPMIVAGGGAIDSSSALRRLAESLDAPVVNTVNAKGVLPSTHPLAVGGSPSCPAIRDALKEADVVLGVGTEFGETDFDFFFSGDVEIPGTLIRIDIDPHQLVRSVKADVAIVSDAMLALDAISNALPDSPRRRGGVDRAARIREEVLRTRNADYAAFFDAIKKALPDVTIVGDSTQPTYYAWLHYETEASRRYFHSASGFGTLGYAIPAAVGAKIATPTRPVVGLIGDGGAQFTIGELASAVEARVAVIFLVWNNSGYSEIKRFMTERDIVPIGVDTFTPDFVALGAAFGCHAIRVETLDALSDELAAARLRDGPSVIEVGELDFVT